MRVMKKDLYEILGVDRSASEDEIKEAFREKVKEGHPDKGGENDKMVELNTSPPPKLPKSLFKKLVPTLRLSNCLFPLHL